MTTSKLEKKVIANALLLDKKMGSIVKNHKQTEKYVIFNEGNTEFSNDFESAIKKGDSTFGEKSGFVVRKIGNSVPVFACLTAV